mmetsp:Transcript_37826/g.52527  ORF Transcript_37826/g.52527 Transcript_37826/m.52527 type:complete len:238 (+) Transcript_37826:146-859(+)|eukprot:CAMPEP_0196581396 /NCGR_PEP_ID=MMETSP1081-20130531/33927_1 /TAXON_ID=36882 /ORGANISM="Pyramimonas amylifera, Strain CCMP720" /LENGTH=237 /DNA_ID=CAMNT_0041901611 /DNA_START=134 /DNA_END=847 /DNA_ORIENTATION=+
MVRGTLKLAPYMKSLRENPLLAPFAKLALWYAEAAKAHPFPVGFATTGIKTSAADLFAQKVIERREEIDWRRQATFTIFGFFYLGGFQYSLYNSVFPKICLPIKTAYKTHGRSISVLAQVFVDQALHHPFLYFPSFYFVKAIATGEPNKLDFTVNKYKAEIVESVQALWMVWVPCQIVNFGLVPMHFRIPFVAGVSFGWTVILSVMQGAFDRTREKPTAQIEEIDDKKTGSQIVVKN